MSSIDCYWFYCQFKRNFVLTVDLWKNHVVRTWQYFLCAYDFCQPKKVWQYLNKVESFWWKKCNFWIKFIQKKKKTKQKTVESWGPINFHGIIFFVGKNEKARLDICYFLSDFRSATSIKEKCDLYSKNSLKKQSWQSCLKSCELQFSYLLLNCTSLFKWQNFLFINICFSVREVKK